MYRFIRILFQRQKYSSFCIPVLSTRQEQCSSKFNSSLPLAVLAATGSFSLYEMYKRSRLYAADNNQSISSTHENNALFVNAQKSSSKKVSYSKQYNFIADVVEHVAPAVVHIEVDLEPNPYFGHFQSPVGTTNGSGFIVNETGLILTNAHVVRNRKTVRVKLADGQLFNGTVESVDLIADLAVVQINSNQKKLPYLALGDSDTIRAGEHCIAVGSPLALSNTVTAGIVSNVGRKSSELGLFGRNIDYIQTDCMITGGNSGGPLVNLDGEVIGINSMKATTGISFSLPINYAKLFLSDIKKKKEKQSTGKQTTSKDSRRQRRYLGIKMFSLTPAIIEEIRYRLPMPLTVDRGVYIAGVIMNSTAQRAGLQPGDIIVQVNGQDVLTSTDLLNHVQEGDTLNMTVVRNNGLVLNITVTPETIE